MTSKRGAYIPPTKLRLMQKTMADKTGVEFQRLSWEALKKSIKVRRRRRNSFEITSLGIQRKVSLPSKAFFFLLLFFFFSSS